MFDSSHQQSLQLFFAVDPTSRDGIGIRAEGWELQFAFCGLGVRFGGWGLDFMV